MYGQQTYEDMLSNQENANHDNNGVYHLKNLKSLKIRRQQNVDQKDIIPTNTIWKNNVIFSFKAEHTIQLNKCIPQNKIKRNTCMHLPGCTCKNIQA